LIIGVLLTLIYRPIIYHNKINDFGFSDTIGSLISVFSFCFIIWSIKGYSNKEKNWHIITTTFIYAFLWEFLGFFNFWGTFDIKDIIAGILSGILTFVIKYHIEKSFTKQK
jgi:hypothetical protein